MVEILTSSSWRSSPRERMALRALSWMAAIFLAAPYNFSPLGVRRILPDWRL
jgi:hypothetical protein